MTEHSIAYWNKQHDKIGKKEIRHNLFRYNSVEEKWLNQHGGRTLKDTYIDNSGKYVVMSNRRVYLPFNQEVV